ncbi:CACTA en-spm transposon protein [Cucumis melo var. makuwa]|uniref:CACTA en-spm transposon protein n=1 Tax=Cucumis melo var. makuwa TaxID=1194695 RepID=A0A5D3C4A8_CUCMM|nr:CACTA en-spm transposon protein [Cucumis melo var. makuwa]TYK05209.1 CACTA en-spm transposon protein [Cucumis melo var. makuwa]
MSLLIPGPKSPGREIDVYLQQLIEELKELWTFRVRGVRRDIRHVLYAWVIDRPSGYEVERKAPPVVMNGHEILEQLDQLEFPVMSKHPSIQDKKRKRLLNWTKKSIFFDLPYWSRLLLCHKLDVMHIEKNICDNLVGTLLNIKGKTKDTTNARLDLQDLKLRKDLHLVEVGNRLVKPHVLELRQSANLSDGFFSLVMGSSFDVRCYNGCIVGGVRFHTIELDSRRTTQNSGIMVVGESDASGTSDNNFYGVLDEVLHVQYPLGRNFKDDLDNIAGGSSSGDNMGSSSQQETSTPRRHAQSRLLELERHVTINGRIPMTIAPGAEKPISPHVVRFSQAIGVCVRKTFPIRCLRWADIGREYIEVVKGDLQRLFVLDFNDQEMNSDPEEARANPPNALVGRDEDWHFLCDHYISRAFQEQSWTNKVARQKQPYNHSSGSKSFLQKQYELAERKGERVDRVELLLETHVRAGTFVSQDAEDAHPTPESSQPLSKDEICDQVLGRRPDYSKGLGWGPKPKARRTASASSSSTSCLQSTEKEIELQAKLYEALERIEVQDRNHQALVSQGESMKKMIEELTRAQQGPPHHP